MFLKKQIIMNLILLGKGLLLGFGLALPVGPIGLLCFRYSLIRGRTAGLVAGLGAATADVFYASLAAFGIAFIINPLIAYQHIFHIVGGMFLSFFGAYLYMHGNPAKAHYSRSPLVNYFSTFFLTLSNPMTLAMFVAFFAILGLDDSASNPLNAITLVAAVFIGSSFGWLSLTMLTHLFRGYITLESLNRINQVASVIIMLFGVFTMVSAII
jgi:threonine/homoserine/homoserine lactone efflux protein